MSVDVCVFGGVEAVCVDSLQARSRGYGRRCGRVQVSVWVFVCVLGARGGGGGNVGSPCNQFHQPGHVGIDGDVAVYRSVSVYVCVLGGGGGGGGAVWAVHAVSFTSLVQHLWT